MSYVDQFYCSRYLSREELIQDRAADEHMRRLMRNDMTAYAELHGLFGFNTDAIRIEVEEDYTVDGLRYKAEWRPRDEWPVEFERGVFDGDLRVLGDKPCKRINLPVPYDRFMPLHSDDAYDPATMAIQFCAYRRAGINPVSNRWVYVPD